MMRRRRGNINAGRPGICVCSNPQCGFIVPKQYAIPCRSISCPKCGSLMVSRRLPVTKFSK